VNCCYSCWHWCGDINIFRISINARLRSDFNSNAKRLIMLFPYSPLI